MIHSPLAELDSQLAIKFILHLSARDGNRRKTVS